MIDERRNAAESFERQKNIEASEHATRERISLIFDLHTNKDVRTRMLKDKLTEVFSKEPMHSLVSEQEQQSMFSALELTTSIESREEFVDALISIYKPLIVLKVDHARVFEDADALRIMEVQQFIPLNERISYSIGGGRLQLHLAPSYERKDQIESYYLDGLEKVVEVVLAHPEIQLIGGSSWLNATKTYGSMKERFGFSISELSEEEKVQSIHDTHDNRPTKNAFISREDFLKRYEKKE